MELNPTETAVSPMACSSAFPSIKLGIVYISEAIETEISWLAPMDMGIPMSTAPAASSHCPVEITSRHSLLFNPSIIRVDSSRFSSSKLIRELI